MAVRVTNDASAPKRSANAPIETAYTVGCWAYLNSATPGRFWGPLGLYAGTDGAPTSNTQFHQISSLASGSASLVLGYDDGAVGQTIALGTARAGFWHFFAMTCNAVAAGGLKAYMRLAHERAFSTAVNSNAARVFTPARFEHGRDGFTGDFIDGALEHCFAFDRALDEAELMKLSIALLAEKPFPDRRNLNVYYRFRGADDIQDRSGNARAATFTVGANAQGLRVWPRRPPALASPSTGLTASSSITLGVLTSTGIATVDLAAIVAKTLGALTSTGQAAADLAAQASITLGVLTSTGTATVLVVATASITLGALTVAGVANVGSGIDASAAITLGALTVAGTATVRVDAASAITLGLLSSAAAAAVDLSAQLAVTLGTLTMTATSDNGAITPPTGSGFDQVIRGRRRGSR